MSKLPRFQETQQVTGDDLNFILSILDSGRISTLTTGVTGDSLNSSTPNISGSIDPSPGNIGAPSTVRGLTASYGIDNFSQSHTAYVLLGWTPNPVADFIARYDIYYHKGSDPTLYNVTVGGDVNSARINNLFPGNAYSFSIQAHDAANRSSAWTPELMITISADSDPPAIPTGLSATSTATGVYLKWNEVGAEGISNDLKQYQVAVSLDGGVTYTLTKTTGPGNSYFYTPSTGGQGTVFFKVATVDWTGNLSTFSSSVSALVGTILGPITISPGPLKVTGSSATGELQLTSGDGLGADTLAQIALGYSGSSPNVQYQSWIQTQHNGGGFGGNALKFWTGDGTANAVFPTNAVLGMTIDSLIGTTVARDLTANARILLTTAASKIVPGATSLTFRNNADSADNVLISDAGALTGRNTWTTTKLYASGANAGLQFQDRNGSAVWEWYANSNIARLYNGTSDVAVVDASGDLSLGGTVTVGGSTTSQISGPIVSGQTTAPHVWFPYSDGNVYFDTPLHYYIRTGSGATLLNLNSNQDVSINSTAGRLLFGVATSKIIPGVTSLSLRNNADSADNLLITNAGASTVRNGFTVADGGALLKNGNSIGTEGLRVGAINPLSTSAFPNYGALLYLSGGPAGATWDSENSDPLWIARYNVASNQTEFRLNIGDDLGTSDALVVGATVAGWNALHTFDANGVYTMGGVGNISVPANGGMYSTGGDVYLMANSANQVVLRPTRGSATNQVIITGTGDLSFSHSSTKIVPGATSLSLRNNADSADNLLIVDAGDMTGRTKLTMPGPLVLTTAASKVVPGATSLSLRNNADSADNLLIVDAGDMTGRTKLTMPGPLVLTTAASKIIPGATSVSHRNNADSADNLLIVDAGDMTGRTKFTMPGPLVLTTAASKIIPGATNLSHRNNADSADNLLIPDNGQAVIRNGLALLGGTVDVGAGTFGFAQVTSNQGTFTAVTDLTSLTSTVTVGAGRRIYITAYATFSSSVANDVAQLYIREGSTTLQVINITLSNNSAGFSTYIAVVLTPSTGSHTYKLSGARGSGTGNITMNAGTTEPAFILVQDIGT